MIQLPFFFLFWLALPFLF